MKSAVFGFIALGALMIGTAHADEDTTLAVGVWRASTDISLTATQASYSENWVGGELGSFNWAFTSNSSAERKLNNTLRSSTTLKLAFGQTLSQQRLSDGSVAWQRPEKTTDLIDLESVMAFTLHRFVDPYVAFRFESQFYDGSVRELKRYLSPSKFTESSGFQRMFSDTKKFKLKSRLGFALRQIATNNIVDLQTGETDWDVTNDGGVESVTDLAVQLNDKLSYTSKLSMYKALFFSESDVAPNDYWKAVDANWEHILTAQLTKFLQAVFYFQQLYDKDIDKGVRLKQTMGLGVSVKVAT